MLPRHLDPDQRAASAARAHSNGSVARDATAAELLARGWPNLRLLVPGSSRGTEAAARKVLGAIDPVLAVEWRREVAVRFLNGFLAKVDPARAAPDAVDAALAQVEVPEPALVRTFLTQALRSPRGYAFQHTDAVFLLEALLGADALLALYADVLAEAPMEAWTSANPNVRAVAHAAAMGWVALRASRAGAQEALERLRVARARLGASVSTPVARAIDLVLGDALPDLAKEHEARLRLPHLSAEFASARVQHPWILHLQDPQDVHVTGVAPSPRVLARLAAEPRWLGPHLVALWAPFAHPFADAVRAAVEARPTKLSKKALDAAVGALFEALVRDVTAVRGMAEKEDAVFAAAAVEFVTLRARSGDPMPEQHVVAILLADGWSRGTPAPAATLVAHPEEASRWAAAIDRALR